MMIEFEDYTNDPNVDFDVHGGIIIWYGEGVGTSKQTSSDSANLESFEDEYAGFCSNPTMEADGYICYNYQLLDSTAGPFSDTADQSRKMYMIAESWTIELDNGMTKDRVGTVMQVIDGADIWEIITFADEEYKDAYVPAQVISTASFLAAGPAYMVPATNPRVVDAFGSSVSEVSVDQQVQIAADVSNGQGVDQPFAYLVQIRDNNNVPVSLAWITGSLTAGQSMSPALSWTSQHSGTYTATSFVWESVDNPIPLSTPVSTTIPVNGGGGSIFSITQHSSGCGDGTALVEGVCQLAESLSDLVAVDADVYDYGNEITISGNFANYDGTSHVTIEIFAPDGNLKAINQISPDSSGSFSTEEIAAGMFSISGIYTVKAYLGDNVLQTTFLFSGIPAAEPEPTEEQEAVVEEPVSEITSLTTYTDPQNRFTIDVPSGWVQSNYDAATGVIDFEDHTDDPNVDFDVHGGIYIWYDEGLGTSKQVQLHSTNLESLEDEYAAFCSSTDEPICNNYQLLGSEVVPSNVGADQSRTKYMIAESWTLEWADGATKDRVGTVMQFIDGDDVWEIITFADEEYKDAYAESLVLSSLSFLAASPAELEIQPITSLTTYTDPQNRFTIDVPSGWINGDGTIPVIVGFDQTYYEDTGEILLIDTGSFDSWNAKLFITFLPNLGATLSPYSDSAILTFWQDALRDDCQSSSSDPHYYCYNHQTLVSSIGPFSGATDQTRTMYQLKGTYSVIYDPAEWPNRSSAVHDKLFIETLIIDGVDAWEITVFVDNRYADAYVEALTQSALSFLAASQPSLVVDTNKSSYTYGESISIVGFVDGYDPSDPMKSMDVTVLILEPTGNIVAIAQVPPSSSGQFSTSVLAGAMISDPGTYTVTAKWAAQEDETSFQFVGATLSSVTVTNAQGSSTPGCEENDECFIPSIVTILPGGTVTWENTDTAAHTATSGDSGDGSTGVWDSSLIMSGGSFSVTLNDTGTYDYYCMVHPWMSGTVVVGDGGLAPEPESEESVVVCDSGIVIDGVCQIEVSQPELNAYVGQNEYNVGDEITVNVGLINTESNEMVIIDVLDPTGNPIVTRAVTVSPGDSKSIEFRISNNFLTGSYTVVASSTIDGETITDTTFFKLKSLYNQFQISSVEVTDQQGNPSTLSKGTLGYIKVSLTSDANITALVTVNLFDADLLTLGVGSVRSTISEGETEIILSFLIPNDAASGDAEIFVNGFTDWISSGGIPLTGEFSTTGEIS